MSRAFSQTQKITKPAVSSNHGIVASQNRIASEIGADVLRRGGNAIDAAVATSFALGVVEPWMSGIGGGGYMVIRRAGEDKAQVIDFGMRAPQGLQVADYPIVGGKASDLFPWSAVKDNANVFGARSVAIPGQVAGMAEVHKSFGIHPWADLIGPAIEEARAGLVVDWYCQLVLASAAKDLAIYPASKQMFLDQEGYPLASAWTALGQNRCDQSALAISLERIAKDGAGAFYAGSMAEAIVADLRAAGGRHTVDDFSNYSAKAVPASEIRYRDHRIFSTPEMTAGPTLERVFDLLSDWQPQGLMPKPDDFAVYDRTIRQANAERFERMGDVEHEPAPSCTTHFNVVDADGTMVAVTQTLLSIFGSRMVLPETGILMNNGIMWFDPEPGKPNSLGAGKRCLANMCPTLLQREDGAQFALGAAGGRKIMPSVAQLASFLLDYEMDLDTAIHQPRIDVSLADMTIADDSFPTELRDGLEEAISPITFAPRTTYPFNFACPSVVSREADINSGATEVMSPWAEAVAEE
ncbi:gamma-glutamyltransferase [Aliiroseovarius subalbicans]|uniref:gamma-glutamyltransferase family protein n=1 Tax=Aliiroseovarius subalbicans TaxID=2925840 RepID=UPI001F57C194|nr:gamma-glutamyltransferase [Aliiroseovarius subalbicans]MCI2399068.1 gamma-glutamyltransferase family protein [Aliiroseovarius subalbicans]